MINSVNEFRLKKINDYSNTMRKQLPISIVTGKDTIFIKTKPSKLSYNYIKNGNQIKNNKILINSINQSSEINQSLKNTFSLQKTNFTKSANGTIIDAKNIKNSKIYELIKIKKLPNNNNNNIHYKGTNSFIKMNRRNNNISNISSSINNNVNNSNNSSNHIFNYYTFMNKFNNNSSTKVKNKIKNKLEKKEKNIRNVKIKNKCNYTDILDRKNSQINTNTHEKKENSKNKRINTSLNRKYNYNKLGNINNYNKDYISFRTMGNEKEINNNSKIKGHIYYPSGKCINVEKRKDKIKKYIYSKEKRKEKSLAEKRQMPKSLYHIWLKIKI